MEKSRGTMSHIKLRAVALITVLTLIMSSTVLAQTYTVDNWEKYKNAITEDIKVQDPVTVIYVTADNKFNTVEDIKREVVQLYNQAEAEAGVFEAQNVNNMKYEVTEYNKNLDNTFSFSKIEYQSIYKNSKEDLVEIDKIISSKLSEIKASNLSDYGKVMAVYEYILDAFWYQQQSSSSTDVQGLFRERNLLLGLKGEGIVCDAYAMLFAKMVTALGFENMIVKGKVGEPNEEVAHGWNLIKIDDKWYQVDATWGDVNVEAVVKNTLEKYPELDKVKVRQDAEEFAMKKKTLYFLTSNSVLIENKHTWKTADYPVATAVYQVSPITTPMQDAKQLIKEATDAVGLAEQTRTQIDINNARNKVQSLSSNGISSDVINELLNRLNNISVVIYTQNDEEETSQDETYYVRIINDDDGKVTGSGYYNQGDKVIIRAYNKYDLVFDKWKVVTGNVNLDDHYEKETYFRMPSRNVVLEVYFDREKDIEDNVKNRVSTKIINPIIVNKIEHVLFLSDFYD